MTQTCLEFEVLDNGNLKVSLTPEGKSELMDYIMSDADTGEERWVKDSSSIWDELIESHAVNGSYEMVNAGNIGALTDAPIIAIDMARKDSIDHGEREYIDEDTKVWWFPDYMVRDELRELYDNGFVIFESAN